jgi:LacI family gluconate utilization system Gnt-I transcriptional repressor
MSSILRNPAPPVRQRRGHGRVTMQEVAALAGVTAITVSRFLREPAVVAPATAERIRAALVKTGYVPHKQAGQLASGHSNMVAAIIPNLANSIFGETVQGLSDALQRAGYELLLASTNYSLEREEEQIRALLGWHPSALAVTGRRHSDASLAMLKRARAAGMPIVELWDRHEGGRHEAFAQVGFDHEAVGRAIAEHLVGRGHTKLVYVDSAVAEDFRAHERGTGFAAAARAAGAQVEPIVAPAGDAFDAGRRVLDAVLAAHGGHTTAAAFANDHLACGALLEAGSRGIAVPQRLALIGFGDFGIGRQLRPTLSTVRTPRYEIGAEAGRMLIAALAEGTPPAHRSLGWTLIERESSAPAQ